MDEGVMMILVDILHTTRHCFKTRPSRLGLSTALVGSKQPVRILVCFSFSFIASSSSSSSLSQIPLSFLPNLIFHPQILNISPHPRSSNSKLWEVGPDGFEFRWRGGNEMFEFRVRFGSRELGFRIRVWNFECVWGYNFYWRLRFWFERRREMGLVQIKKGVLSEMDAEIGRGDVRGWN